MLRTLPLSMLVLRKILDLLVLQWLSFVKTSLTTNHNCLPCWITVFKLKQDHFTIHHHVSTSIFQNSSLTGLKMKLVAWTRWLKFNVKNQAFFMTTLSHLISTRILSRMLKIVLSATFHLSHQAKNWMLSL